MLQPILMLYYINSVQRLTIYINIVIIYILQSAKSKDVATIYINDGKILDMEKKCF